MSQALCQESFYIPELPLFNNLIELHVESTDPMNMACDALLTILRHSPRLEALYFAMVTSNPEIDSLFANKMLMS